MLKFYVELGHKCGWCNEEYIRSTTSKTNFCSPKCRHEDFLWRKEWNRRARTIWRKNQPKPKALTWLERKEKNPKGFTLQILLSQARMRAKRYNYDFELTKEWFKMKSYKCAVTGINFVYDTVPWNPFGPSIDRINNSIGYTKDNSRVVIWAYNVGKFAFSDEDVYKTAEAYLEYNRLI